MRLIGCLLLLSGIFLVLAALVLFTPLRMRFGFAVAGCGVEVLGMGLLTQGHKALKKGRR